MTIPKDEFREGYSEGRNETSEILNGKEMSTEYSYKMAKLIMQISFVIAIISLIYFWLIHKLSFFISALYAFGIFWASFVVFGILVGLLILAIRKNRASK